jgi:hypothetical protein
MAFDFPKKRSDFQRWINEKNAEIEKITSKREMQYPALHRQLEYLWQDMKAGIVPGKDGKFYESIADVKRANPFPEWKDEIMMYDFSQFPFIEDTGLDNSNSVDINTIAPDEELKRRQRDT